LKLDAKCKDALYGKALSLVAAGSTREAASALDRLLALDPKHKSAYDLKGQIQESQGKYVEALASYNKALELDPKYSIALNNKMHILLALKKEKDAMDIFLKI
jgi:predicted Zn-dependent protease